MITPKTTNKAQNYTNVLLDNSVGHSDYVEAVPALPCAPRHLGFLPIAITSLIPQKMPKEHETPDQQVQTQNYLTHA